MANTKSAEKQNRQRVKRRARNLFHLSTTRTLVKRAVATISEPGTPEQLASSTALAMRQLNKAAQKGVLKKKTASRKISRLAKALAKVQQTPQAQARAK